MRPKCKHAKFQRSNARQTF